MEGNLIPGISTLVFLLLAFLCGILFCLLFLRRFLENRSARYLHKKTEQFVGLASHYLFTPISIIQTGINRLLDEDANLNMEERYRLYDSIARGQQRLWIIAEQLVLINEIDEGELAMNMTVGNLAETLSTSIAAVDIFAREKRVKVFFKDYTDQVKETRYDPRRMKQALIAIIDNAIKFSMEDAEVICTVWRENNLFRITVEDKGIGMPAEILQHITERFYRGGDLYHYEYEGLGLGLHIAHAIIRFHQGSLTFTSHEGKGTVALIEFPVL
jgi:signal transduction histidine kinase